MSNWQIINYFFYLSHFRLTLESIVTHHFPVFTAQRQPFPPLTLWTHLHLLFCLDKQRTLASSQANRNTDSWLLEILKYQSTGKPFSPQDNYGAMTRDYFTATEVNTLTNYKSSYTNNLLLCYIQWKLNQSHIKLISPVVIPSLFGEVVIFWKELLKL